MPLPHLLGAGNKNIFEDCNRGQDSLDMLCSGNCWGSYRKESNHGLRLQEDNVKMGSNVFFSLTCCFMSDWEKCPRPSVTPISNDIVVLIQRDRPRAQDSLCIISNLQKSAAVANENCDRDDQHSICIHVTSARCRTIRMNRKRSLVGILLGGIAM